MAPKHLVPMLAAMCSLGIKPHRPWWDLCFRAMAQGMAAPTGPPDLIREAKGTPKAAVTRKELHSAGGKEVGREKASGGGYSAVHLSSAVRSLALMGVAPNPSWARAFLLACYSCWDDFTPAMWTETAWALSELKVFVGARVKSRYVWEPGFGEMGPMGYGCNATLLRP